MAYGYNPYRSKDGKFATGPTHAPVTSPRPTNYLGTQTEELEPNYNNQFAKLNTILPESKNSDIMELQQLNEEVRQTHEQCECGRSTENCGSYEHVHIHAGTLLKDAAEHGNAWQRINRRGTRNGTGSRIATETIATYIPNPETRNIHNIIGAESVTFHELNPETGSRIFTEHITQAKNEQKFGASVYVYPEDEYKNMRLFVNDTGTVGFAIKTDGDIVSVFSSTSNAPKNAVASVMPLAIQEGGKKADCFDTVLPKLYSRYGFKETNRDKWDDQYMPDGWNKETFKYFNNGEPDVVYLQAA